MISARSDLLLQLLRQFPGSDSNTLKRTDEPKKHSWILQPQVCSLSSVGLPRSGVIRIGYQNRSGALDQDHFVVQHVVVLLGSHINPS